MTRAVALALVELLVVIAVTALLLAILIPALEKARRQAQMLVSTAGPALA